MHAMARAFPRQVCTASVPHHKGRGKNLAEGRLEKEAKINDYILSSPQENGKNKKSSTLPVVTSLIAHQQQITKTQLDTSSSLISTYTQCSTYHFLSIDLTKHLKNSPTNKIVTDQKILKIYHATPLHAARTPNHIPSLPRDYKLHSRQRRRLG